MRRTDFAQQPKEILRTASESPSSPLDLHQHPSFREHQEKTAAMVGIDEMNRIQLLLQDRTDTRVLLATPNTPRTVPLIQTHDFIEQMDANCPPSLNGSLSTFSTVSSESAYRHSDTTSRKSGTVTIASSVMAPHEEYIPPPTLEEQLAEMPASHYQLTCEFSIIDCPHSFHPLNYESWMAHTLSHFQRNPPPPKTICIFCDTTFDCEKRRLDVAENWQQRMEHIHDHFRNGVLAEVARPDYFVINHMYNKGLMSDKDYTHLTKYTERPYCPDLVPLGWEPEEKKMRKERSEQLHHDLDREKRIQRRENRTQKGKGKERHSSSRQATALMQRE